MRFICEFLHSQMCMRSYITRVLARAIIKKIPLHYREIPIYVSTHGSCIFFISHVHVAHFPTSSIWLLVAQSH